MADVNPITNAHDYAATLARIDQLMDAEPGTAEGRELDLLTDLVEMYRTRTSRWAIPTPRRPSSSAWNRWPRERRRRFPDHSLDVNLHALRELQVVEDLPQVGQQSIGSGAVGGQLERDAHLEVAAGAELRQESCADPVPDLGRDVTAG